MDDIKFEELLASVKYMGKHVRGEKVPGAVVREFPDPDVKAIRERTGMSQTRFAEQRDTHFVSLNPLFHKNLHPLVRVGTW